MMALPVIDLAEFISRTGSLLIHLHNQCNLQCKHCYLDASPRGDKQLALDIVTRTLKEAECLGIKTVQFSGGEPFLYPYLKEVLETTKGKSFNVSLSTNATRMDKETAQRLIDINAHVVTSIDGPNEYHEEFRGAKGCFAKSECNIRYLVDSGIPITVVTTLCEDNFDYIDWCVSWAYDMNVDIILFQPLESVGRGRAIASRRLAQKRLHELYIRLNDLAVLYADKGLQVRLSYESREYMIEHPCKAFVCNGKRCHRGVEKELKKIVIREDGTILPELVDIDRRFAIGNLYEDTLENSLKHYLTNGYERFDQLCRKAYKKNVKDYPSPLIPWEEIVAEESRLHEG